MTKEQLEQMLKEVRGKRDKAFEEYQQYHGAAQVLTHLLSVLAAEQRQDNHKPNEEPLYELTE